MDLVIFHQDLSQREMVWRSKWPSEPLSLGKERGGLHRRDLLQQNCYAHQRTWLAFADGVRPKQKDSGFLALAGLARIDCVFWKPYLLNLFWRSRTLLNAFFQTPTLSGNFLSGTASMSMVYDGVCLFFGVKACRQHLVAHGRVQAASQIPRLTPNI